MRTDVYLCSFKICLLIIYVSVPCQTFLWNLKHQNSVLTRIGVGKPNTDWFVSFFLYYLFIFMFSGDEMWHLPFKGSLANSVTDDCCSFFFFFFFAWAYSWLEIWTKKNKKYNKIPFNPNMKQSNKARITSSKMSWLWLGRR